ncbi:MAG: anti-anti-sigma factor [Crocinitomicaceae bacterium]|nr:anti-anti-sigma factor [Crocinitomicaceae bacterium]|tara:strand:- start:7297 stop:7677 length:381 start_codon:yes stop_codon:yes gene_type:complete
MSFKVEKLDKCTVIRVMTPKLNSLISPELKGLFNQLSEEGAKNIVLDLSNAKYCDSSGLSAILIGNRLCSGSNGSFVICGLNDVIKNLIQLSRLDNIIEITPTAEEAHDMILLNEIESEFNQDDKN